MRLLGIVAAVFIGSGLIMSRVADRVTPASPAPAPAAGPVLASASVSSQQTPPQSHMSRSVLISRDTRGHFQTDARIEGRSVSFMVDTGASVIALNETAAARIGVRPSRGDFTASVSTANGTVKAARVRLASVDVGGLVVRDVDAMVLPDDALSENLLGLSYLSRLRRFEYANGRLVLEQ